MSIQHKILSFDSANGSVLVRYFTDENPNGYIYNVDVPMIDGEYVNEEELIAHIKQLAPAGQLERVDAIKIANVPDYLSNIVSMQEQQQIEQTQDNNEAIKQIIREMLAEEGLI